MTRFASSLDEWPLIRQRQENAHHRHGLFSSCWIMQAAQRDGAVQNSLIQDISLSHSFWIWHGKNLPCMPSLIPTTFRMRICCVPDLNCICECAVSMAMLPNSSQHSNFCSFSHNLRPILNIGNSSKANGPMWTTILSSKGRSRFHEPLRQDPIPLLQLPILLFLLL